LQVTLHGDNPDTMIVTFDHWDRGKASFTDIPAQSGFAKRGYTHLHISTCRNDWFLNPDMPKALLKISRLCEDYPHKITIAFSMGGFGALLLSRVVAFRQLLLISPHSTYSKDVPPYDNRFAPDIRDEDFARTANDMVHSTLRMEAECVVLYDSTQRFDTDHAQSAARLFTDARLVDLRGGGHPAIGVLQKAGRYGLVRDAALGDGVDETALVEAHYKLVSPTR
jgi:hypothetical protein